MPRRCSVSGCSSNYDTSQEVSFFSFPVDFNRRQLWIRQMRRKDFVVKKNSLVCIKHFEDKFIDRELRAQREDGSFIVIPRKHPVLTKDAYPTIFNSPHHSPVDPIPNNDEKFQIVTELDDDEVQILNELDGEGVCSDSEVELDDIENSCGSQQNEVENNDFQRWLDDDKINDLSEFKLHYQPKLPSKWLTLPSDDDVYLAKVNLEHVPELLVSIKVKSDLSFNAWCRNIPIPQKCFRWLFGKKLRIESWTRFECLLNHLNGYDKQISIDLQLKGISSLVKECARSCTNSKMLTELLVISQQLKLISSEHDMTTNHAHSVANHVLPKARKSITRRIQI